MEKLKTDISGTEVEIRITEVRTGTWRWLVCAIADRCPRDRPGERHTAAWSDTAPTAMAAFNRAFEARNAVVAGYEP